MTDKDERELLSKSDDRDIHKQILQQGRFGNKPYEYSECRIKLECSSIDVHKYNTGPTIIGNSNNEFERNLDTCLMSMFEGEVSQFTITTQTETVSLKISLIKLKFLGVIYNWDAKKRYDIALYHKERGVELFKREQIKDSAYRFTKALKIILSVPLDVQDPPTEVDGVSVIDISALKANLYNNMSSCYLKSQLWAIVIEFCNKVFRYEPDNVKALYKIGVAYRNDKNFEKAEEALEKLLRLEADHAAAKEQLQLVKAKLKEENVRVNNMVKKMFQEA